MSDLHRDLAGDIDGGFESVRWAMRTFAKPVIFVPGNHELVAGNKTKLQGLRDLADGSMVAVLDNEVIEHGGVRFLGCSLWAPMNPRMRDCMNESIRWLRNRLSRPHSGKTVVVTHYPPLHQSLDDETRSDAGLAMRMAADLTGPGRAIEGRALGTRPHPQASGLLLRQDLGRLQPAGLRRCRGTAV